MKHHLLRLVAPLILLGAPCLHAEPPAAPTPLTARQLVALVVAQQPARGLSARARMTITAPGAEKRTLQILIKSRRDGAARDTLYLTLFPAADKGRAIVIRKDAQGNRSGFSRAPDGTITRIDPTKPNQALFGSDISLDDLTEEFWTWQNAQLAGEGTVCRRACTIVDLKPPHGHQAHALVRVWIDPTTALPLRIESYNPANKLLKRTEAHTITKAAGGWVVSELSIESAATPGHSTTLDFSKGSRDLDLPAADFTPEAITRLLQE